MVSLEVQQVELRRERTHTVVWVDAALRLRPGHHVIGKDGHAWEVVHVYDRVLASHLLNRGWAVGGLFS